MASNRFSPDAEENAERIVDAVTAGFDRLIAEFDRMRAAILEAQGHAASASMLPPPPPYIPASEPSRRHCGDSSRDWACVVAAVSFLAGLGLGVLLSI